MRTIRQVIENMLTDPDPGQPEWENATECAFIIVSALRLACHGETSYEAECGSLALAMEQGIDIKTVQGIRNWLDKWNDAVSVELSDEFWQKLLEQGD